MSTQGFLSRWSRRKLETQTPVEAPSDVPNVEVLEEAAVPLATTDADDKTPDQEFVDEELVATLPDVESLTAESDFSAFMQHGVPEQLRKLALRKLWRSNPVLANLDGLNEYDEDYSTFTPLAEGVAEELQKLMKENSRTEPEEEVEQQPEALAEEEADDSGSEAVDETISPSQEGDDHEVAGDEEEF